MNDQTRINGLNDEIDQSVDTLEDAVGTEEVAADVKFSKAENSCDANALAETSGASDKEGPEGLVHANTPWAVLEHSLSSGFFLFLCILESICTLFSLIHLNVPETVVMILICISMWMTYARAKGGNLAVENNHMKLVTGSMRAMKILNMISIVAVLVLGLLSSMVCLFSTAEFVTDALYELIGVFTNEIPAGVDAVLSALNFVGIWGALIILSIMVVLLVILIVCDRFYGNCVKGAQAFQNVFKKDTVEFKKFRKLKKWLLIFGVLSCFGFVSFFTGAFLIVTYIFVDKLIDDFENIGVC